MASVEQNHLCNPTNWQFEHLSAADHGIEVSQSALRNEGAGQVGTTHF